jgi:DNA-binding response OmpR family regulator
MALALDWTLRYMPRVEADVVLLDFETCRLLRPDGTRGPRLAGKPLAFLEALARRPGAVVRRGAMERELWEHDHDLADPVAAAHYHALRVRDALEALGWPRSVIATVDEVGWCIDMDEVERVRREAGGDG